MKKKLTEKAKKLITILMKLQLPEEKIMGIMALLQTDEQIDQLCAWVKKNPAQLTMKWKSDLIAAAVAIGIGEEP